jgi:hypothetical protein
VLVPVPAVLVPVLVPRLVSPVLESQPAVQLFYNQH